MGALFAVLASCAQSPDPYPRYKGKLDLLFGRWHRISSSDQELIANNNVSMIEFNHTVVVAYRTAETHFASPNAKIVVVTSDARQLEDWTQVWSYRTGNDDLREVLFFELNRKLFLYFVRLAPFKNGFSPRRSSWTSTQDLKIWSPPADVGRVSEIIWDVKVVENQGTKLAYKTSYTGNHYASDAVLSVLFEQSVDGAEWKPVGKDSTVYVGGVSEVSFTFTAKGDLVAIGRNEDGDASGFGSQLFFARQGDLGTWTPLKVSIPYRFDSPRMCFIEGHVLLLARYARERYAALPRWMPFALQRIVNLVIYSILPKNGAAYHLKIPDDEGKWCAQPIELIRCFEDTVGDTGFFSITKDSSSGNWLVANYASRSTHSHTPWIYGQVKPTDVLICRLQILNKA